MPRAQPTTTRMNLVHIAPYRYVRADTIISASRTNGHSKPLALSSTASLALVGFNPFLRPTITHDSYRPRELVAVQESDHSSMAYTHYHDDYEAHLDIIGLLRPEMTSSHVRSFDGHHSRYLRFSCADLSTELAPYTQSD